MVRVARDAGKRQQDRLFNKWGGAPTTQLLRHRNTHFDAHTKERFHAVAERGIGKVMPTPQAEAADPTAADELYRAATKWLINQTRGDTKRFGLVFKENIAFGFHRNAFGVRWLGASVAFLCLLIIALKIKIISLSPPYASLTSFSQLDPMAALALGVSGMMLIAWLFWFTEAAAKRAGFAYAERLLESCYDLESPRKTTSKKEAESQQ
ncbi:hypothetical protein GCM10010981_17420 [Dyella nitratireducens]|uniref:Uncharacterized protein n=2 Tax=Dyella nitratireducens TaxID=1849580 RepID=A0ABQ1FUI0_9GAMM|nr:hypothetical protein GCM10010981_17420 [Dyella nitratireducens]GLQ43193.1 hypothetical protein GCM10007902_30430 [Dyella nitratireducens]